MAKFKEAPLTREDLNEATEAELVERVMLARRLLRPALPMLLPFWTSVPKGAVTEEGRGAGAFLAWLFGYRTVTRADITPGSA